MTEKRTFNISLAGETRPVEFTLYENGNTGRLFGSSASIFAARIGRGVKLNRSSMSVWEFETVADARKAGYYGEQIFTDVDGKIFGYKLSSTVRNRTAYILGWADHVEGTEIGAKHNAYNAL